MARKAKMDIARQVATLGADSLLPAWKPDNLTNRIRALVAKGELTHLSLNPRYGDKKEILWAASYSPSSGWGHGFGLDADPVTAILAAIDDWRPARKPRKAKVVDDADLPDPTA